MDVLDLGVKSYEETWALQKELIERRANGECADTLILVEHPAVYTVGRASQSSLENGSGSQQTAGSRPQSAGTKTVHVPKLGSVPVIDIERGGKLTFHGPGQLVGYPIFELTDHDLRHYLREIERILMTTLVDETMLPAKPCPDSLLLEPGQLQTGVWIRDRKIASIGIAVKRWVSYHGFALNLTTDLRYFEAVEPCGFNGRIMTTVEQELGVDANMDALKSNIKRALATKFSELSKRYESLTVPAATGAVLEPSESL